MPRDDRRGYTTMDRRDYLRYLGIMGAFTTLAGCTGGDQGSENTDRTGGSSETTLVVGQNTNLSGDEPLDPHKAVRIGTQEVLFAINEPLFRVDPDLQPAPHLAKDYTVNENATEHTIKIQKGITFHNGEKLTGEIARWNLERFVSDSPESYLVGDEFLKEITVTGDYEIKVTYKKPFPLLPRGLTAWNASLVSRKAVENAGNQYGQQVVVGTGPYKFKEWSHGSYIATERFDAYDWGPGWVTNRGPGKIKEFRFESHPEPTTLLNELTDGGVHLSKSILLADTDKVDGNPNTELKREKFTRQAYLCPNTQKPPMDDVRVRKAVVHAINKKAVIQVAIGGEGYKIWALMPPMAKNTLSAKQAKKTGQTYNPDKARQLLENAGWTNSKQGQVRTKGGTKLSIDFLTFTIPREKRVGTTIQPMLKDVGFDVNLRVLEAGTLYNQLSAGSHDLVVMGYGGQYSLQTLSATLTSERSAKKGGSNYSLWRNDEFDSLISKARTIPSDSKRHQALIDAQLIVQKQAPVVPILAYNKVLGHKKSVKGTKTMVSDHPWWPVKEYLRHLELSL
ncbi:ABC transporter substrate-binding protein [Halocatena marina]|uniref:ABC transporter substrate-binding protein n=1 Tax=Halocatena marina TaxID=2934937 RepID=UPI00200F7E1D|nr:ABC transporter substrate-binding protein [Halocatena marina]